MFVGRWHDDAIEELRALAGDNVTSRAGSRTRSCTTLYRRASVYVQASRHEGFGLAVAEAMLAGCVPVVMNVTAMPEVVGDAGVLIDSQRPEDVAAGISRALELGPAAGARARERILTAFPMAGAATGSCRSSVRPSAYSAAAATRRRVVIDGEPSEAIHSERRPGRLAAGP